METVDMTFDALPARSAYTDLPMTDVRTALTQAAGALRGNT
jgi:hypothetical protein